MSAKQNSQGGIMCECSKGYTCPQHVARVNANAAGAAKRQKPRGMTIRQAVAVMQANRGISRVFARNKETRAAARILMGAYFSSGERGCPSFQQVFERFAKAGITAVEASKGVYTLGCNGSYGYYVAYVKDRKLCYLTKNGEEILSCNAALSDGTGGYFKSRQDAEAVITVHKNESFKVGDTVRAVANPRNGLSNEGYFTVGQKFVIEDLSYRQRTVKLAGKDGYWDKSRFELVDSTHDNKWTKLVKRIGERSYTLEKRTETNSPKLITKVLSSDVSACLNKNGFPEISYEHVYLENPITQIGYYKVLLNCPDAHGYVNLWVVPL